jgi:toxin ParE1/3/4
VAEYRLSGPAAAKIREILVDSERDFGSRARERYAALLVRATIDVATDPGRPGVEHYRDLDERIGTYHVRYSRDRVPDPPGRVGHPRHVVAFRSADDGRAEILGILHDRMLVGRALRKIIADTES